MTNAAPEKPKHTTVAAWKKAKVHEGVTLPSGQVVSIEVPNLATLISSGDLPNELLDDALEMRSASKITKEALLKAWEFAEYIVPRTVVEPKIAKEDLPKIPIQDVEMLAAFASRVTDMDAVGHQLGGLETVKSFRNARGILSLDEIGVDL